MDIITQQFVENEVDENNTVKRARDWEDCVITRDEMMKIILLGRDDVSVCTRLFPMRLIGDLRFQEGRLNEDLLFMVSIIDKLDYVSYKSGVGYFYFKRSGSISRVFGKSVRDMIGNAKTIRAHIDNRYSLLSKEAERFEIFQNMAFLLCCPSNHNRKEDDLYHEVLSYVRKNTFKGLVNPYLTFKNKLKLLGVVCCPRFMSILVEKKKKKK